MNDIVLDIASFFKEYNLKLAVAESITAGMIMATITSIEGSSSFFEGGIVSYTKKCKKKLLKIPKTAIKKYTPYSHEVVKYMALKVRKHTKAHIALAISGLAGPSRDNASEDVEIGDIFIAVALNNHYVFTTKKKIEFKERESIRKEASNQALKYLLDTILENKKLIFKIYKRFIHFKKEK